MRLREARLNRHTMWPDVGRRWLPTWLPRVDGTVADLPDKSANRQRARRQLVSRTVMKEVGENARGAGVLLGRAICDLA
jgi:hypothetical protein